MTKKNDRHADRKRRRWNNGLEHVLSCLLYLSLSGCPEFTYYPEHKWLLFRFPSPPTFLFFLPKTVSKITIKRLLLEKWLFLIHISWWVGISTGCLSTEIYSGKEFCKNRTLHWGWEQGTKWGDMVAGSTVEDRKRLGSLHHCESWGQYVGKSQDPGCRKEDQLYCIAKFTLGLALSTRKKSPDSST